MLLHNRRGPERKQRARLYFTRTRTKKTSRMCSQKPKPTAKTLSHNNPMGEQNANYDARIACFHASSTGIAHFSPSKSRDGIPCFARFSWVFVGVSWKAVSEGVERFGCNGYRRCDCVPALWAARKRCNGAPPARAVLNLAEPSRSFSVKYFWTAP